MLRAKRVHDPREEADGTRVLLMRLSPRGIKKSAIDLSLGFLCSGADAQRGHRPLLRIGLGLGLAAGLIAGPAVAEHEPQYRFTVLGYVKDSAGTGRKGAGLEVTRQKTGLAYQGETDAAGLYVIVMRLADESRGERLLVRAGPAALWVTARFDPADHTSERGTRVDFAGGKPTERPELFALTLKQFLSK